MGLIWTGGGVGEVERSRMPLERRSAEGITGLGNSGGVTRGQLPARQRGFG